MGFFAITIPEVMYIMYRGAVPVIIFAAFLGFRWREGFWGNLLSVGTVFFSILAAVGWGELLAYFMAVQFPKILFFADWIAAWTIFVVVLICLECGVKFMSRVKVKFIPPVEYIGNTLSLLLLGTALYGFYRFTEDMAPLGERIAEGDAKTAMTQDTLPITTFRMLSIGNLACFTGENQFDETGTFREHHLKRRQAIMYYVLKDPDKATLGYSAEEVYRGKNPRSIEDLKLK